MTLENVFKILNNYVHFQNIIVRNEPLIMMNVSSEAAVRRCSSKEVLLNILQYSQEDACVGAPFY